MRKVIQRAVEAVVGTLAANTHQLFWFYGQITQWRAGGYGYVGLATLRMLDGAPHMVDSEEDIYIHNAQAPGIVLGEGVWVKFTVKPRPNSTRKFRAYDVELTEPPREGDENNPGTQETIDTGRPSNTPTGILVRSDGSTWEAPEETFRHAVANHLLDEVSREIYRRHETAEVKTITADQLELLLRAEFADLLNQFGPLYRIDHDEPELTGRLNAAIAGMRREGLGEQASRTSITFIRYARTRAFLKKVWQAQLLRPNSTLPIRYVADLLMAAPVWFFHFREQEEKSATEMSCDRNPQPHIVSRHLCEFFPTQQLKDLFQMFNRRLRSTRTYQGDSLPAETTEIMHAARTLFDIVAIATPYHTLAGQDWGVLSGEVPCDPFVIAFKRDLPQVFFLLDRFSDTGFFPAFEEMVCATIEFLKTHRHRLQSFNGVNGWCGADAESWLDTSALGARLIAVNQQLIQHFEDHTLTTWLWNPIAQLHD